MAHYVICKICQERFNRDKEPAIPIGGNRYAHKKCVEESHIEIPQKTQSDLDYEALEKYIMNLFDKKTLSAKIQKQIRDYRQTYNYSYSGMLKTLKWWYEIKGNTLEKSNQGIGIVPFIYDDACKYYYSLWLAETINQDLDYKYVVEEVEIAPPTVIARPPKLFSFEEMEE